MRRMKVKRLFMISIIMLSMLSAASATDYYVDKNANGSNNGTSWSNAWESFADINWSAISPGDVIYISGGSNSKTYYESLDVSADGTSSSPITITKGDDSGHNGDVIIDGQMSRDYGIRVEEDDYITIKGFHVKNHVDNGQIRVRYCTGAVVDGNDLYITGFAGVYIRGTSNSVVKYNRITTPSYIDAQTDGIHSNLNSGNRYYNNHIVITNNEPNGHNDGIQVYDDDNTTMNNNYIELDNNKEYNSQGIYITESSGTMKVYNNVIYGPNTKNSLIALRNISSGNAKLYAYNNTLVGSGWGSLRVDSSPYSRVKNNILVCYKSGGCLIRLDGQSPSASNIDYNVYYAPNSSYPYSIDGGGDNWSSWRNAGFDSHGKEADPKLEDINNKKFELLQNSPAIDAGVDLGSSYNRDPNGTTRPQGNGWDMGVYEFLGSPTLPQPPDNLNAFFIYP